MDLPLRRRLHLETLEERSSPTSVLDTLAVAALARERASAPALVTVPGTAHSRTLPPPQCGQ
jgi:hypothetical protein